MSFSTDSIFIAALSDDTDLMAEIDGRIYSTAIPMPDEEADNVPLPYLIVSFDGLSNDQTTKDDPFESDSDSVSIGITIATDNREQLALLAQKVREVVHGYMMTQDETSSAVARIEDYALTAEAVQYDQLKPCYWQVLKYQCDVENPIAYEQD